MIEFNADLYKELQEDDRLVNLIKKIDRLGGELIVDKSKEFAGFGSNRSCDIVYDEKGTICITLKMPKFKELYDGFSYRIIAKKSDLILRLGYEEEKHKKLIEEEKNYKIESSIVAFWKGAGRERDNAIYVHNTRVEEIERRKENIDKIKKMLVESEYDKAVNEYEMNKVEVINTIENMLNEFLSCKQIVENIKFT